MYGLPCETDTGCKLLLLPGGLMHLQWAIWFWKSLYEPGFYYLATRAIVCSYLYFCGKATCIPS